MKKIIVADDSSIIVNIARKAFENEYEVVGAFNGRDCIQTIQKNDLNDVVGLLLDLNMPEVDGFAVLDFLKQNDMFTKVPTSIITGDDNMEVIEKAFEYPIIDVLKKPFTMESVRKIIEKTISISSMQ